MTALKDLSTTSLDALASAIDNGRLLSFSHLQLRDFVGGDASSELASEFQALSDAGFSAAQLARLLRLVVADRQGQSRSSVKADLVWTSPGSTSSSRDTGVVVRELFSSARESVLLAGFAVHRGREIFRQLAQRMSEIPSLDVKMFLNIPRGPGDTTVSEQLVARFVQTFRRDHWSGTRMPYIYYDPRSLRQGSRQQTSLHAKCVVIDGEVSLVTSANFTEAAQERNIEVGALIHDVSFAQAVAEHFSSLIRAGAVVALPVGAAAS